ncbi:uncharacterized protein UDID_18693 [Ustilago sp. UG-2017a]|nr:uncharacterized protein UDID_18693 [Ustilago sp. UG-2017a]
MPGSQHPPQLKLQISESFLRALLGTPEVDVSIGTTVTNHDARVAKYDIAIARTVLRSVASDSVNITHDNVSQRGSDPVCLELTWARPRGSEQDLTVLAALVAEQKTNRHLNITWLSDDATCFCLVSPQLKIRRNF